LTGNSAGLTTVLSSHLTHTELRSSLRQSHSSLSLPAHTTMAPSQGTPFLSIYSEDEHRTIYFFPNTTSYSTFYAFFPSFRITLWPMWLANSKQQPCFYPPQSHAQEDTQNCQKKLTNLTGKLCCAREHFSCIGRLSPPIDRKQDPNLQNNSQASMDVRHRTVGLCLKLQHRNNPDTPIQASQINHTRAMVRHQSPTSLRPTHPIRQRGFPGKDCKPPSLRTPTPS
jgi:hypothetical protein